MIGASPDMLEDDLRPAYDAWKRTPGPASNAAFLKALSPTIEGAVRTHVGQPNPLILSRARVMAIDGLPGYDPKRGRLKSYLYNHLLGLKRVNKQQTQILKVPERVAMDSYNLSKMEDELRATLGTEPTDEQIADATGFHPRRIAKVRSYQPGVSEGYMAGLESSGAAAYSGSRQAGPGPETNQWADVVYGELDDYHKRVMEHTFGLGGRRRLSNQDLARKLNRSPGAVSQAKARIQKMLDEGDELSPFGGM